MGSIIHPERPFATAPVPPDVARRLYQDFFFLNPLALARAFTFHDYAIGRQRKYVYTISVIARRIVRTVKLKLIVMTRRLFICTETKKINK